MLFRSHRNYPYANQPIDEADRFEHIVLSRTNEMGYFYEYMEKFFTISLRELVISRIAAMICRLGGRKYLTALVRKLRKADKL